MYVRENGLGFVTEAVTVASAILPMIGGGSNKVGAKNLANLVATTDTRPMPGADWNAYVQRELADTAQENGGLTRWRTDSKFVQAANAAGMTPEEYWYRRGGGGDARGDVMPLLPGYADRFGARINQPASPPPPPPPPPAPAPVASLVSLPVSNANAGSFFQPPALQPTQQTYPRERPATGKPEPKPATTIPTPFLIGGAAALLGLLWIMRK
jgi:hypothetical protein